MTLLPEVEASLLAAVRRDQLPGASRIGTFAGRRSYLRPVFLTGPLTGIAVAAVVAFGLGSSATAPAFAVTDNANGTVTVTIRDISGLAGLNAEFARRGIRAVAVPIVQGCITTLRHGPPQLVQGAIRVPDLASSTVTFTPGMLPHGDTLVVAARQTGKNQVQEVVGVSGGPTPTCVSDLLVTGLMRTMVLPPSTGATVTTGSSPTP